MVPTKTIDCEYSRHLLGRLERELWNLLGPDVAVVCTGVDGDVSRLWIEERTLIGGAIASRQREFAAGRLAARAAIRRLNGNEEPVPANSDRSPCWPAGIVGSIAHSTDVCLAVVGLQSTWTSIGVDIEIDRGIEETLWDIICTPEELSLIREEPSGVQGTRVAEVFVAKEALYKWHHPQRKILFDFQAVSLLWSDDRRQFRATADSGVYFDDMDKLEGRFLRLAGCLIACCATRQRRPSPPSHI
jgi:enterobactin synthetase component D